MIALGVWAFYLFHVVRVPVHFASVAAEWGLLG